MVRSQAKRKLQKNVVTWSHSIDEAGDLLELKEEKYTVSLVIFRAVSVRRPLPPDAPVYVDQHLDQWEPQSKTVNIQIYADLIQTLVGHAAKKLYPRGDAIW